VNVVVVQGVLSSAPRARELPSGDRIGTFEVTVRDPGWPTETVPVSWLLVPEAALRWPPGTNVVVCGRVRRRFFGGARGRTSRTEIVALEMRESCHVGRVLGLIDEAVAVLSTPVAVG
jgi:single-strand DNA-binding protein